MEKLKILDLFSGIGGFSYGLEKTGGFETVAFCEMDKHCNEILGKHWPEVPIFKDVSKVDVHSTEPYEIDNYVLMNKDDIEKCDEEMENYEIKEFYHGEIDILCGGFPCQDISVGGKQRGLKGERSGLWTEYKRLIQEIRPRWAIIENVERLRKNGLGVVIRDLAKIGYDAEWHCITANSVGYPHQRDRLFIIAHPSGLRQYERLREKRHLQTDEERQGEEIYSEGEQCESESEQVCSILSPRAFERIRSTFSDERATVSSVHRTAYGISDWLDQYSGGLNAEESKEYGEILQILFHKNGAKKIQRTIGGLDEISAAKILFSILFKLKRRSDYGRLLLESPTEKERILREMWEKEEIACSSYQSECSRQFGREFDDFMRKLSHNSSLGKKKNWAGDWKEALCTEEQRKQRIKQLGNAIVPRIAEIIGTRILEVENERKESKNY